MHVSVPQTNGYKAVIITFTCCSINLLYDEILGSQITCAKVLHPKGEFYSFLVSLFLEIAMPFRLLGDHEYLGFFIRPYLSNRGYVLA